MTHSAENDAGGKCPEVHRHHTYRRGDDGRYIVIDVPCFRAVDKDGRHRGKHQGWLHYEATHIPADWLNKEPRDLPACDTLVTWNQGGSRTDRRGTAYDGHTNCPLCGVLTPPATDGGWGYPGSPDAFRMDPANLGGACFDCRLWAERIEFHAAGWNAKGERSIRLRKDGTPSDRLNCWSRVTGAFGDWRVTVRWDDGDQRGPQSSMWDCGAIPWWLDEQFPVNAELVPTRPISPAEQQDTNGSEEDA